MNTMRNLLLFMLDAVLSVPGFAQLNCNNVNAAFSLSASGGLVTLTNSSTPTSTSTILTSYTINWGDNSPLTYAGNNSNKTHTYNRCSNCLHGRSDRSNFQSISPRPRCECVSHRCPRNGSVSGASSGCAHCCMNQPGLSGSSGHHEGSEATL